MKKFFYLFALLTLVMFTSCNDDDDYQSKQTFTAVMNNRAVLNDDVVFSQSNAKIEYNSSDATIQITSQFKDVDGQTYAISTPEIKMGIAGTGIYSFATGSISGNTSITGLQGYIDMNNYMMWYTFVTDKGASVYCTTHLLYSITTTTITNVDGNTYNHSQSAYLVAIDSKGESGIFRIGNFIADTNGTIQATAIDYNGVKITPTMTGYLVTADEVASNMSGYYKITDLNIIIDNQGQHMSGSFKVGNYTYNINGSTWGNL